MAGLRFVSSVPLRAFQCEDRRAGTDGVDTATVDYNSRVTARHIFRLASMTEKPISVP